MKELTALAPGFVLGMAFCVALVALERWIYMKRLMRFIRAWGEREYWHGAFDSIGRSHQSFGMLAWWLASGKSLNVPIAPEPATFDSSEDSLTEDEEADE